MSDFNNMNPYAIDFNQIVNKDPYTVTVNLGGTNAATASNYGVFYTAQFPCEVLGVSESHGTAGTDGSAVTLQIEKLQTGVALGNGTALLSTAVNLKATANVPIYPPLIQTQDRQLLRTDRLALKLSGTPTAVAGLNLTMILKPLSKGHYTIAGTAFV